MLSKEWLYDLANHHARRRCPADLAHARSHYAVAFPLLSSVYATTRPDENQVDEAIGRTMFAIACLAMGHTQAATDAIARVDYISRVLGLSGGQAVVAPVRARIDDAVATRPPPNVNARSATTQPSPAS